VNSSTARKLFAGLNLPMIYFQCADGTPTVVHSHTEPCTDEQPAKFELVVHYLSKQGDWDIALRHDARSRSTTVFWALDSRSDVDGLLEDLKSFQNYSFHPMVIPCIMFSSTFAGGLKRRHSIKQKMALLEEKVRTIHRRASQWNDGDAAFHASQLWLEQPEDVEVLSELLHACRREVTSREGQYESWRDLHASIQEGFAYTARVMADMPHTTFLKAHSELQQWFNLTWRRLESLRARDMDHVTRIDNVAVMVGTCSTNGLLVH